MHKYKAPKKRQDDRLDEDQVASEVPTRAEIREVVESLAINHFPFPGDRRVARDAVRIFDEARIEALTNLSNSFLESIHAKLMNKEDVQIVRRIRGERT